jgi:hypothetical protein
MEQKYYRMNIAGLDRDLPICPLNENLMIAGFVIFGDPELTTACSEALLQWGVPSDSTIAVECDQIARSAGGKTLHFLVNRSDRDIPIQVVGRWFDPVSGKVSAPPSVLKPTQSGFLLPGVGGEGKPDAYSADLFVPPTTWAQLLREDELHPEDVDFAVGPRGGFMMLSYPEWFKDGMGKRPTQRKWFTTWKY